ncbi:MAG: FAD-binding protein [Phycisphaerae bacterium]|nr:FAD-binding protein [Phycisphaerae bacterium]
MPSEKRQYSPVTPEIAAKAAKIVGEKFVIFGDTEKLEPYSHDEIPETRYAHTPECVVRPRTAEEISGIMKLANAERIPVTPRGAGSGLSGGAVPICGGIVLLFDRMNRILQIDRRNMVAVVEPGVVTNEINVAVKEYGLFYAGYPMSLETCYIGGNVAENAGGGKAVKYGVTERYVTGLELVTPTGQIVQMGGKRVKDVTGYNLIGLMLGSEGTLGIFTKITLKLIPSPKASADLLCLFQTPQQAIAAVPLIQTTSGIIPTAIEFMDAAAVKASAEYLNESIPYERAGAMLLITIDGPDTEQVEQQYEAIGELSQQAGAFEVYVADNYTTSERIWRVRRNIGEALATITDYQSSEDLVVPPASIPKLVEGMDKIAAKYDVAIPCYGHAGDGNMHTRVVMNPDWAVDKWDQTLPRILTDLYKLTAALGGTISGEHGIGHKRKPYLGLVLSAEAIEMMRSVKRALDPNNILNPGKIFDV